MRKTTLGRTGLTVGVAGLGCGGHSRLGLGAGGSESGAADVVRAALDLGVNFIDTAQVYGTEGVVGAAIGGRRDEAVLSTKVQVVKPGTRVTGNDMLPAADFTARVEDSLRRLGTDHIDVLHLHGVTTDQYDYCHAELVPALIGLRDAGKVRFFGLTERFIVDPQHRMLQHALADDCWDVVMTGFNMINPSARRRVFSKTRAASIGTLVMFAVRRALSDPDALAGIVEDLVREGIVDGGGLNLERPLDFLVEDGLPLSVIEAAYRFCRHEPGADIVLTGTGNIDHLRQNLTSLQKPALPAECLETLERVFGEVDCVSGN